MTVPKQRHTKGKRNKRRMHIFLKQPALSKCLKCGVAVLPHTVCKNCGYYKGVEYINVLERLTKKEKKLREKEIKEKETESASAKASASKEGLSWEGMSKK